MGHLPNDAWTELFSGHPFLWWVLWAGLALLTILLLLLIRTRWGQAQPLRKCIVLSLLAHVLLAGYATTVQIVQTSLSPEEPSVQITSIEGLLPKPASDSDGKAIKPWETFADEFPSGVDQRAPKPASIVTEEIRRQSIDGDTGFAEQATLSSASQADVMIPEPAAPRAEPLRASRSALEATLPAETATPKQQTKVAMPAPISPGPGRPGLPTAKSAKRRSTAIVSQDAESLVDTPVLPAELDERPNVPRPDNSLAGLEDRPSMKPDVDVPTEVAEGRKVAARTEAAGISDDQPARAAESSRRPAPLEALSLDALTDEFAPVERPVKPRSVPSLYENRTAAGKVEIAQQRGGSRETEATVQSALAWLARHQSDDGRWDASRFGAGHERHVDQRDRRGAGANADTAVTGLALLAFLGAGQTHLDGEHTTTVARGLEFVVNLQRADGSLGGNSARFAFMYSHGMATLALSEAYAMTSDRRLESPLRRAIAYTLHAQHPTNGGWRYRPGDRGDTSQLGWQLMALRSAESAGIPIPDSCRRGMVRFLQTVASGRHGGLASYRAGEQASRSMTAEALVCRQFLGMQRENPASDEAGDFLLGLLPGEGTANLYYWYYGTLGMFQLGGRYWDAWNEPLKSTLIKRQRADGDLAGSWDPDTLWGSHGGRVYTTALGALCLEVYYRYLPLFAERKTTPRR